MKKWLLLLLTGFSLASHGQETFPTIATSGGAFGHIMLGMSEAEVRPYLVGSFKSYTYKEKMQDFKSYKSDLRIDSIVCFVLGFDKMLTYDLHNDRNTVIYNLAFKNDKLNMITYTSYGDTDSVLLNVLLDQSVKFNMTKE